MTLVIIFDIISGWNSKTIRLWIRSKRLLHRRRLFSSGKIHYFSILSYLPQSNTHYWIWWPQSLLMGPVAISNVKTWRAFIDWCFSFSINSCSVLLTAAKRHGYTMGNVGKSVSQKTYLLLLVLKTENHWGCWL